LGWCFGDEISFIDNAGDVVTENAGEGNDTVFSTVVYTLSANMETLLLRGPGDLSGTGKALSNALYGNAGNNMLNGCAGRARGQGPATRSCSTLVRPTATLFSTLTA
jgi:Ca2+-binding RTX toxin-like protein